MDGRPVVAVAGRTSGLATVVLQLCGTGGFPTRASKGKTTLQIDYKRGPVRVSLRVPYKVKRIMARQRRCHVARRASRSSLAARCVSFSQIVCLSVCSASHSRQVHVACSWQVRAGYWPSAQSSRCVVCLGVGASSSASLSNRERGGRVQHLVRVGFRVSVRI